MAFSGGFTSGAAKRGKGSEAELEGDDAVAVGLEQILDNGVRLIGLKPARR
jgi:hypothetical protein